MASLTAPGIAAHSRKSAVLISLLFGRSPCRLLLLLAASTTLAHAQLQFPSIANITRESAPVVSAGDVVTYRFTAIPGTAPIRSLVFYFSSKNTHTSHAIVATDPASGIASARMEGGWANDSYRLETVSIRDEWERVTSYTPEGVVDAGPTNMLKSPQSYYAGPPTHAMDFSELGFELTGAATLPTRSDLTDVVMLTTTSVSPGQSVQLRTKGVTGSVPLTRMALTFSHTSVPFSYTFVMETATPNGDWSFPIPGALRNGLYHLTGASAVDRDGREVSYDGSGTAIESVANLNYRYDSGGPFFRLQEVIFTVQGASGTVSSAPRLSLWERSGPNDATPGSTVRFRFDTQPDAFPAARVWIQLSGPFGSSRALAVNAASGTFDLPVTGDWINGTYNVTALTITDTAGRTMYYLPLGGSIPFLPTAPLPPSFPRESFGFTVHGARDVGPYFVLQPDPETIVPPSESSIRLTARSATLGPVTYQWYRGEVGDTSRPLAANPLNPLEVAANLTQLTAPVTEPTTFWVRATTNGTTVDSQPARVRLRPADYGRLTNVSILTRLTDANDNFTLGCVAGGDGATGTKQIVVRAAGPSLGALGVTDALVDPRLQLYRGSTLVAENDDWGGTPALTSAMAAVGAFAYASPSSRDAATLASFAAAANHTVKISGTGAGRVIAELYDAGPGPASAPTAPRLMNLSVLKNLGDGLTVGFAIGGTSPVKILVRAVGPGLAQAPFNIANAVSDPRVALFRGETRIAVGDNWGRGGVNSFILSETYRSVGAFPLPDGSKDAVLLTTLSPGTYTVQVKATGDSGMVLVEVYEVP